VKIIILLIEITIKIGMKIIKNEFFQKMLKKKKKKKKIQILIIIKISKSNLNIYEIVNQKLKEIKLKTTIKTWLI